MRRTRAWTGCANGSKSFGARIRPASSADCDSVRSFASIAKYELRRRLDAVRALPEVHGVEVLREDLVLGELVLELPRQQRLVDLALERLVVAHVELLHELLGDRGPTFDDRAGRDVRVRGADDRAEVDAVVVVEALVLDRDHGVADGLRHLRPGEHDPVDARVELRDEAAVRRVEERRLGQRERPFAVVGQARSAAARRRDGREHDEGNEGESRALPHLSESTRGSTSHW